MRVGQVAVLAIGLIIALVIQEGWRQPPYIDQCNRKGQASSLTSGAFREKGLPSAKGIQASL